MKVLGHKIELLTGTAGSRRPLLSELERSGARRLGFGRLRLELPEGVRTPADSWPVRCRLVRAAPPGSALRVPSGLLESPSDPAVVGSAKGDRKLRAPALQSGPLRKEPVTMTFDSCFL